MYSYLSIEREALFGSNSAFKFEGVSLAGVCCCVRRSIVKIGKQRESMRHIAQQRLGPTGPAGLNMADDSTFPIVMSGLIGSSVASVVALGGVAAAGVVAPMVVAPPIVLGLWRTAATRQSLQRPPPDYLFNAMEKVNQSLIEQALDLIARLEEEEWGLDLNVVADVGI
ncbi:hypothetical protein B0J13DRAFT_68185 [Dactylonectria estremocensis]|uniref:Uncharacterized protein n=1 Tax=Dactylonectria estremocensis TaxID=1079267 RepID=A0A9P9EMP2_9HYPO|nr:hypothetical protein B0J13DRAFT_68185 [Dactylonectria estremocensis]